MPQRPFLVARPTAISRGTQYKAVRATVDFLLHYVLNFFGFEKPSLLEPSNAPMRRLSWPSCLASGSSKAVVSSASRCVHLVRPDRPKFLTCSSSSRWP